MVHRLIYAAQCPNCTRFLGALERTPVASRVQRIDVATLSPEQRRAVPAVPMLVLDNGTSLVGSQAFQWLKQYEGEVELDTYEGARGCRGGLGFSDVSMDAGLISYAQTYSAFGPGE